MVEKTHVTNSRGPSVPKRKLLVLVGGTTGVLIVAALVLQFSGTETGSLPATLDAGETAQASGTARVSDLNQKRPMMACVTRGASKRMIFEDEVARECIQRVGKEVLDSILNRATIELACGERGISVTPEEVNQEIHRIAKEFNVDVANWYQVLQTERNLSPAQYQRDVIWPMLALKKLAGEDVTVTPGDLQKAFEHHYGPRVKARIIMLDNIRRANEVWETAVRNPDDFERLARQHSVDPNSRALDGSIHPIPRHSGSEELEKAAFKLKEGEISGIIQFGTPARYVILKCEGRTEQIVTDMEDVRETLTHDLMKVKIQESVARVFETIKNETRVDNYLTDTSTGRIRQTSGTR